MLRNLIVIITLIVIALLPFVTGEHNADIPSSIRIVKDIPYVPDSTNERQTLDICIPRTKEEKKLPVVVWIHGGGWRAGSKSDTPALELAKKGYATVSINYRLTSDAIFPAQIHDCKAAIRYIRSKGAEYNLDTSKIAVWGVSAGGHLAALLGTSQAEKALEGDLGITDASSEVNVVCDWCGPTDLTTFDAQAQEPRFRQHQPERLVNWLLGGTAEEKAELAEQASPVHYIKSGRKYPPFLIVHSKMDPVIPIAQSEELLHRLKQVNADAELISVNSDQHVPMTEDNLKLLLEFLDKHMKETE